MEAAERRLTSTPGVPGISFLSWDTEGNVQTKLNLLRDGAGVVFHVETNEKWVDGKPFVVGMNAADGSVDLGAAGRTELRWSARTNGAGMVWSLANKGSSGTISRIRITLPFNPRMAADSCGGNLINWAQTVIAGAAGPAERHNANGCGTGAKH